MALSRMAILVEASRVPGESDLPGARVDVVNFQDYLGSAAGSVGDQRNCDPKHPFLEGIATTDSQGQTSGLRIHDFLRSTALTNVMAISMNPSCA